MQDSNNIEFSRLSEKLTIAEGIKLYSFSLCFLLYSISCVSQQSPEQYRLNTLSEDTIKIFFAYYFDGTPVSVLSFEVQVSNSKHNIGSFNITQNKNGVYRYIKSIEQVPEKYVSNKNNFTIRSISVPSKKNKTVREVDDKKNHYHKLIHHNLISDTFPVLLFGKNSKRIDKKLYKKAVQKGNFEWYSRYLMCQPNGAFRNEIFLLREPSYFEKYVSSTNKISDVKHYLNIYPQGIHFKRAQIVLDSLEYKKAQKINSYKSFLYYLDNYPNGQHRYKAKEGYILLSEKISDFIQASSKFPDVTLDRSKKSDLLQSYLNQIERMSDYFELKRIFKNFNEDIGSHAFNFASNSQYQLISYRVFVKLFPNRNPEIVKILIEEEKHYHRVINKNSRLEYQKYLDKYPKGNFSYTIYRRMNKLPFEYILSSNIHNDSTKLTYKILGPLPLSTPILLPQYWNGTNSNWETIPFQSFKKGTSYLTQRTGEIIFSKPENDSIRLKFYSKLDLTQKLHADFNAMLLNLSVENQMIFIDSWYSINPFKQLCRQILEEEIYSLKVFQLTGMRKISLLKEWETTYYGASIQNRINNEINNELNKLARFSSNVSVYYDYEHFPATYKVEFRDETTLVDAFFGEKQINAYVVKDMASFERRTNYHMFIKLKNTSTIPLRFNISSYGYVKPVNIEGSGPVSNGIASVFNTINFLATNITSASDPFDEKQKFVTLKANESTVVKLSGRCQGIKQAGASIKINSANGIQFQNIKVVNQGLSRNSIWKNIDQFRDVMKKNNVKEFEDFIDLYYLNKNPYVKEAQYLLDQKKSIFHFDNKISFRNGRAIVKMKNKYGIINEKGEILLPIKYDEIFVFSPQCFIVKQGSLKGLVNKNGKFLLKIEFEKISGLKNGMAIVKKKYKSPAKNTFTTRVGFINNEGQITIPLIYDQVSTFKGEFAAVKKNGKWGFININGETITPFIFDEIYRFNGFGLATFVRNGKYGFINSEGIVEVKEQFDDIGSFNSGLAVIEQNNKYGYINIHGKIIVPPIYDQASQFNNGIARVKKFTKYGFINNKGDVVIKIEYDFASDCGRYGLIHVYKILDRATHRKSWGIINQEGDELLPLEYSRIGIFHDGLAKVEKKGDWGFIDRTGKIVIPIIYDWVEYEFQDGRAKVSYNGKMVWINKKGEITSR